MVRSRLLPILLLLLCSVPPANAARYTLTLPSLAGAYDSSDPLDHTTPTLRTVSMDFGTTFASIDSVSITASGWNYPGLAPDNVPVLGEFYACLSVLMEAPPPGPMQPLRSPGFYEDLTRSWMNAGFGSGIDGSFSGTYGFINSIEDGFYHLLDGKADLLLGHSVTYPPSSSPWPAYPYGQLDSVSITIEGTAAPEPSGLGALLGGLAGLGLFVRRRIVS